MRLFLFVLALALLLYSNFAHADYVVWQDSETGLSLTYPDTWRQANNAKPDDVLTIAAPSGRAFASCRVRVRQDGRFLIYPQRFDEAIQHIYHSNNFFDMYFGEYLEAEIEVIRDRSGIGRAFAGSALAVYKDSVPGPMMPRKAVAFAGHYFDKLFIFECSSHRDAFAEYQDLFQSIANSVQFKKIEHELSIGDYRDFLNDNY